MKRFIRYMVGTVVVTVFSLSMANAQAIKTNLPFILTGNPNLGVEFTIGKQFSVSAEGMWMPYLFKKKEEVFRAMQLSAEFRYYIKPKYYHTNDMWDGFYLGPYAMFANYNIGLEKGEGYMSQRYKGWALSTGLSLGYKIYLSNRLRMDFNLGIGYALLQYDVYQLGSEHTIPYLKKQAKGYIGPTKVGISLVYNIFR